MNVFAEMRTTVVECLDALVAEGALPDGLSFEAVAVEPPRDPAHGDMATNAAMVLAKPAGRKPRDIAEALAARLGEGSRVASAEVAGPGFINLRLDESVWDLVVTEAIAAGADFGRSGLGAGQKVNVEYVSTNPTGPLHVGHTRGAVFGDALAALLDFSGYAVTREYYINDGGGQVDTLARSAYQRYLEAHGRSPDIEDGMYPGDYLVPVGEALKAEFGDRFVDVPEAEWLDPVRSFAIDAMMDAIRHDLARLGVTMDVFYSEKSLQDAGKVEAAIDLLREKDLIYRGTLEPPKGKTPEDWEPREQTLFRSTAHGDDVDRPILKSDGAWTYFASDIAYHADKIGRGFDELIDVLGADHGGYVRRMTAAVSALSDGAVPLDVKLCQIVRLYQGGAEVRMSKRTGNFITLAELIDDVGADVARFVMLTRKNDAPLDFDFDKVREQSKDNAVFYVQYAHARYRSVMRRVEEMGVEVADRPLLEDPAELAVARKIAEWPRLVELAARNHEPHRVAFYLYDLAAEFHALWNRGTDHPALRFVHEDTPERTTAKIALPRAVGVVIAAGLGILGVTPAEELR